MSEFTQKLAALSAQHLRDLAEIFATLDENDRDSFILMMRTTLTSTGISSVQIGDSMGTSAKTAERWAEGRVSPHPVLRSTYRDWLVKELHQRADMIDAFPDDLGSPKDDYIPQRFRPHAQQ